jgi:hypothetical protein
MYTNFFHDYKNNLDNQKKDKTAEDT